MKAHRLLNIDRGDTARLSTLAPTFAVVAACTVILASLSSALFLSSNPISLLPWMFLGAAAITAATSLGYVGLMRATRLVARSRLLLLVAIGSLLSLRAAYPLSPALAGVVILLWCPTLGHLLVLQTWNVATSLLPTRQGKRMMPVLAAVTTLGAVLGGLSVQLLLRYVAAEDLLILAAILLLYPLFRLGLVIRALGGEVAHKGEKQGQGSGDSGSDSADEEPEGSEIARGFRSIFRKPLLTELALLTFLLQAASLVIDYQFSAEIKPHFDKEGIAAFLGTFYWTSNLVVLLFTLLATSRAIKLVGIGVALAASGIVIGVGSGLYFFAAVSGLLPLFWVMAATAFAERVASYSLTKPAIQIAYMPLQTSGGERAKTLIDGVIHRLATAAASVLLLLAAPELSSQFRLSLPAMLACVAVLTLGLRVRPHYRTALFEALRARRLDAHLASFLRVGLGRDATRSLEAQLQSDSPDSVLDALDVARELHLDLPPGRLDELAEHEDDRVVRGALRAMDALGRSPSSELLARMLASYRPARLLRSLLMLLSERATPELAEAVRPLTGHADAGVASAACVLRIRAAGAGANQSFEAEVLGRTANVRVTGMTRAGDFVRELPELIQHPKSQVRLDAIEQMGELGLAMFVAPLIACLDTPDGRKASAEALARFGDRAMPSFREHLEAAELRLATRIVLLRVVERVETAAACALLVETCKSPVTTLRDHAVEALWRRALLPKVPDPEPGVLRTLILGELSGLKVLSAIELSLLGQAPRGTLARRAMFASELSALQVAAERRVFRLLGVLCDRAALQRSYLHYRSEETRARSNAIELLEQHIRDPQLRSFVPLIERQEDAQGNLRPRSIVVQGLAQGSDMEAMLREDPWLRRLWTWVGDADDGREEALNWDEPLDRLVLLKRMPMFSEAAGEPLLCVANALERRTLATGARAFERDSDQRDIFWLLDGEVALEPKRGQPFPVRRYECFGEMAAISGLPHCYDAVATSDATLLHLAPADFEDAVELLPGLVRGVIEILSRRLRARIG